MVATIMIEKEREKNQSLPSPRLGSRIAIPLRPGL
jgi:hypothetical protein